MVLFHSISSVLSALLHNLRHPTKRETAPSCFILPSLKDRAWTIIEPILIMIIHYPTLSVSHVCEPVCPSKTNTMKHRVHKRVATRKENICVSVIRPEIDHKRSHTYTHNDKEISFCCKSFSERVGDLLPALP